MTSVGEALAWGRQRLAAADFAPPTREAALLLGTVVGAGEARLLARPEAPLPAAAAARYRGLVERRLTGEPVAYLTGRKEFFGRWFAVDRRVLVPRPETEHVVEAALELELPAAPRILDVGTGSGCLGITLALELPGSRALGVDRSPAALAVAQANARRLEAGGFRVAGADLATACRLERYDLVVANPPYVDPDEAAALPREVRDFEPPEALVAPRRHDSVLLALLAQLAALARGARVVVELGHRQGAGIAADARGAGFELARLARDYAGIERVAVLIRS